MKLKKRCQQLSLALILACVLPVGCRTQPLETHDAGEPAQEISDASRFSGQAAWQHMRALNELGRRVTGSSASQKARELLRETLSSADVSHRELRTLATTDGGDVMEFSHVLANIPGRSNDVILLAAHYDLPSHENGVESAAAPGRNDQRASGSAFLLEFARVVRAGPVPDYTLWIVFIDGDAARPDPRGERLGTRSLAEDWSRTGELANIRAAIFFGAVGDRDLPMLRDIDSPRVYRELFWDAARDAGFAATFPATSPYGRADTGRSVFAQVARRSSVALQNAHASIVHAPAPEDASSQADPAPIGRPSAGFDAVGQVTLDALERVAAKLRRIDRFAQSPLTAGRDPVEPPAAKQ